MYTTFPPNNHTSMSSLCTQRRENPKIHYIMCPIGLSKFTFFLKRQRCHWAPNGDQPFACEDAQFWHQFQLRTVYLVCHCWASLWPVWGGWCCVGWWWWSLRGSSGLSPSGLLQEGPYQGGFGTHGPMDGPSVHVWLDLNLQLDPKTRKEYAV